MKHYKKIILTLVALLAVTTGAWAESKPIGLNVEYEVGDEITSTTDVYVYYGEQPGTLKKMGVKITNTQPLTISMIFDDSFGFNGDDAVYFLPDGVATGGSAGFIPCFGESTGDATVVHVASGSGTLTDPYVFGSGPSGTPVPITWNATTKTASIAAMPAGNVIVEPEYFAVAEFTDGGAPTGIADIKATTDDDIVKAGTVKNIGSSTTPQGTVMYYAVQSATAPTAPDYDATGWTDKVPTATDFAEGNVYVWYYIKGAEPASGTDRTDANTCSDSEITALGTTGYVTLLAAPKYNAEFAFDEGTPDAEKAKWGTNIPDGGVVKGTAVTVTYTGAKKVLGMKVAKKVEAKTLAEATAEDKGKLIGTDGNIYADVAAATAAGTTAVAKIIYIGTTGHATYSHGLALALTDEGQMTWEAAKTACNTTKNTSTPVTGATWLLASKDQWDYMLGTNGAGSYTALRDGFTSVGGSNLQSGEYWSSTEVDYNGNDLVDSDYARYYYFNYGGMWSYVGKGSGYRVRACLAF